jgi:hypothetical protein
MKIIIKIILITTVVYTVYKLHKFLIKKYNRSPINLFNLVIMISSFLLTGLYIFHFQK